MILVIISMVLILLIIVLVGYAIYDWQSLGELFTLFITAILAIIFVSIPVLFALANNVVVSELRYQETAYTREVLEYRLDQVDGNVVGNELLYKDVVEFNNELRITKFWGTNIFTNWLNNQKIVNDVDYIEIEREGE